MKKKILIIGLVKIFAIVMIVTAMCTKKYVALNHQHDEQCCDCPECAVEYD